MIPYSVLISVYHKEQPEYLRQAIESMFHQTVPPDEMVLVCDGPLTESLNDEIAACQKQYGDRLNVLRLDSNVGLGGALCRGVQVCRNEWIARMDSDDIAVPDRMEKQLAYIAAHPEISVVGGQIVEFERDPEHPVSMRCVPLQCSDIIETLQHKNPMNHVTTVFRKADVLKVGNYECYLRFEDYQLWAKLLAEGYQLANIPECCCYVRSGTEAYRRRGGLDYFHNAVLLQKFMLKRKLISVVSYIRNLIVWFAASVLLPSKLRGFLFKKFMRNRVAT